jgi:hypothetical protein
MPNAVTLSCRTQSPCHAERSHPVIPSAARNLAAPAAVRRENGERASAVAPVIPSAVALSFRTQSPCHAERSRPVMPNAVALSFPNAVTLSFRAQRGIWPRLPPRAARTASAPRPLLRSLRTQLAVIPERSRPVILERSRPVILERSHPVIPSAARNLAAPAAVRRENGDRASAVAPVARPASCAPSARITARQAAAIMPR